MTRIDANLIKGITDAGAPSDCSFAQLGLVGSSEPETLSFLDQEKFLQALVSNPNISGAFVAPELAPSLKERRPDLVLIEIEDPRWAYYFLYNHLGQSGYRRKPSSIAPTAEIHSTAVVSDHNVTIGDGTIIGPKVVILPDVHIGRHCVIQAGTVIGSVGFELKRTSRGILSVFHDGVVDIRDRVEIGSNTCIDKGFRGRPTLIEDEARIDNLVHVAHAVIIRRGAFVIAGTVLGGSSEVCANSWLSINASVAPGVVIGEGGFVSIGAVVTRHVPAQGQVTGNFAIPHQTFLKVLKSNLQRVEHGEA